MNLIKKIMETWRVKLTAGGKSFTETKIQKYISRRCSITSTIYNCNDASQPHTQKMHSRIETC